LDSQQVRLIIGAWKRGWLDKTYVLPTSKLREDLLLREVKNELLAEIFALKTVKDAAIAGGLVAGNQKNITIPDKAYDGFIHSVLPSILTTPTINTITPEKAKFWTDFLNEKNKQLQEDLKNSKPNV
jgi:translation initiation factor 6 (eIF-6)